MGPGLIIDCIPFFDICLLQTFILAADVGAGTYTVTLAPGKEFDYETVNSYTITARAFDGVDSATAKITVEIDDVGEAPTLVPDTPVQTFTIDEDTVGKPYENTHM